MKWFEYLLHFAGFYCLCFVILFLIIVTSYSSGLPFKNELLLDVYGISLVSVPVILALLIISFYFGRKHVQFGLQASYWYSFVLFIFMLLMFNLLLKGELV